MGLSLLVHLLARDSLSAHAQWASFGACGVSVGNYQEKIQLCPDSNW